MSKQIKITPTDGLHAAITAYAKEHNISSLAKASAILVAQALNYTETPVNQHGGNRMKKETILGTEVKIDSYFDVTRYTWRHEEGYVMDVAFRGKHKEIEWLMDYPKTKKGQANWDNVTSSDQVFAELRKRYPEYQFYAERL